ncbi:hypothetical protein H4R99_002407 [Coemansia sp. RSA 1722]|nr:hypothetical protein LPJ57_002141 [Coemansia sp. RSA 486]KAJ2603334.1 hypothetical protein H4R99_002407 [Coemansia sp. RSA 1722]
MSNDTHTLSCGPHIFNNEIILAEICKYLPQGSLAAVSVVSTHGWKIAIARIWDTPYLTHIEQLRNFVKVVSSPLPISINNKPSYGSMVRKFDLSMLAGRWEKLGSNDLEPVFKHCTHISELNINLCQNIMDSQLVALFANNPEFCSSIRNLDIGETMYSDKTIAKVIRLLPRLNELRMNETYASSHTVKAVAETQGMLFTIELFDCDVTADDILTLFTSCSMLMEIGAPFSLSEELEDKVMEFDMERCCELYFDHDDDYSDDDLLTEVIHDVMYL